MKLSPEEIPSRIQAITGKRGRPRNAEKAKTKETPAVKRGRGRPPKVKMVDLLSKTDARLLKRLEAQGTPPQPLQLRCCPLQPTLQGGCSSGARSLVPASFSALAEVLSDEDKLKMSKIKKKMRRKVRVAVGGKQGEGWGQFWGYSMSRSPVGPSCAHWLGQGAAAVPPHQLPSP